MQNRLKILVAGDHALDRLIVRRALSVQHPDVVVQEAGSCSEAISALTSNEFDCALLDSHFPNGSGLECLADMREAGVTTPIILLTEHADSGLAAEAIRAGATDYLPMSDLTPQLLGHCLRSALRYHQSQEQVRRAHEALQLRDRAISAASSGIIICDPHQHDCPIIYVNPAFSAITGYTPEEVLGHNCRFLQGVDTQIQYIQQMRDCLRDETECQIILRNYKKDGTPFWNDLAISPVRGTDGRLTHFIGVQTDITERRNAEEALRLNVARQQSLLRDMFSSVTEGKLILCASEDDLPEPLGRFADPVHLSHTGGIRELRRHTLSACVEVGIPDARRFDLETAVGETAMNAVVHTGGGTGHVFAHERGTVQVRVEDSGRGIAVEDLPNATLKRGYSSAGTMGYGFKIVLQTVDGVHLLTGHTGTIVVIEQNAVPKMQTFF